MSVHNALASRSPSGPLNRPVSAFAIPTLSISQAAPSITPPATRPPKMVSSWSFCVTVYGAGGGGGIPCSDACRGRGLDEFLTRLHCGRLLKKTTSRAAMAPAAKLGDSQMMFFMGFLLGVG